jgi:histidinol-phosphate aminotransferase
MSRFWSDVVRRLTPYVPGEQPRGEQLTKLNTNESPYEPSPRVLAAIAATRGEELRLYPDPDSARLKGAFAAHCGLRPEQVFLGNGSDEVLAHTFLGLLRHEAPIQFPDVTYSFYPVWCDLYGVEYRRVPLADDFSVDPAAYHDEHGGIIIPNPNAPTGMAMSLDDIRALLGKNPDAVVVIDEAYIDFGGSSAVPLIAEYENLLVIQTLSKSRALAGLRVGAAMGQAHLIEGLERVKNSFNSYPVDCVAQRGAVAALEDVAYFRAICARVVASRERLARELAGLGFEVLPSEANFLLARHPDRAGRVLFSALRERGVIVRYFEQPRIDDYLRISVGTDEQCDTLLAALREILA